jgi:NAD(P)-dependent dehydrogenase (short-subunit alcohol dehydrogenase family)
MGEEAQAMSVVLITGCNSGFGLETALAFARRGDAVYATMRDLTKGGDLVERAKAENLTIELLALDVNDDQSVADAVSSVEDRHGAIDVLVNNAGTDHRGPVETIDFEKARAVMETNFWGPVRTIRAALPAMRKKGGGVIVNVSSVTIHMPGTPYWSWYSASKHALNAVTEALYIELDGFDVRVVSVEPGFYKTDMVQKSMGSLAIDPSDPYASDLSWLGRYYERSVRDRGGDPAEVASAIVRVATDPTAPVSNLVGEDTAMLVSMAKELGPLEAWRPAAVSFASTVAGPRPKR